MAEYIDKERLISALRETAEQSKGMVDAKEAVLAIANSIEAMPSADAVEVVRCGNCKHSYVFEPWEGINATRYCKIFKNHYGDADMCVDDDDYCSYGERKDEIG